MPDLPGDLPFPLHTHTLVFLSTSAPHPTHTLIPLALPPPAVVGDFRALLTVTVFRTTTVTEEMLRAGLSEEAGYEICVAPQRQQAVRFDLLHSTLTPAAAGSAAAAYDFE